MNQKLENLYFLGIEKATNNKSWFLGNFENFKIHFLDKISDVKIAETKPFPSSENNPSLENKLKIEISAIEREIIKKKNIKKLALRREEYTRHKSQSKTHENYMDYNQDTAGNENKNMERKVFYKWQWDMIRKIGNTGKFLQKEN